MKDWKLLATALDLGIPEAGLEKIRAPLQVLEDSFRPLVASIPLETEPAYLLLLLSEERR